MTTVWPFPGHCSAPASQDKGSQGRWDLGKGACQGQCPVKIGCGGGMLPRDREPWVRSRRGCPPNVVLVQQVGRETLASHHPPPHHPRPTEMGARTAPLHTRFIDPFVQNCFSHFILQTHHPPSGRAGGAEGTPQPGRHLAAAHPPHLICTGAWEGWQQWWSEPWQGKHFP